MLELNIGGGVEGLWSVMETTDEAGAKTAFVMVRGELWGAEEKTKFEAFIKPEHRIVLMSSYMTFPGLNINPYDDPNRWPSPRFVEDKWKSQIVLWCHCFRHPELMWSDADMVVGGRRIPRLLLSESDFYDPGTLEKYRKPAPREYDFFCSMPEGDWNTFIRNVHLGAHWLNFMADAMGLRVLVVGPGRVEKLSKKITVVDRFLPWHEFVEHMGRCTYMFNSSFADASPRIVVEALSLDMPVLLNQDILGGWKYVEPGVTQGRTGAGFRMYDVKRDNACDLPSEAHMRATVLGFTRGKYDPLAWVTANVGPKIGAKRLAEALNGLQKN
jgi:hypothetical protein